jgi:hypothetical protein
MRDRSRRQDGQRRVRVPPNGASATCAAPQPSLVNPESAIGEVLLLANGIKTAFDTYALTRHKQRRSDKTPTFAPPEGVAAQYRADMYDARNPRFEQPGSKADKREESKIDSQAAARLRERIQPREKRFEGVSRKA